MAWLKPEQKKTQLEQLQTELENAHSGTLEFDCLTCIWAGENNANDTYPRALYSLDWWDCAYDSIAFTCEFNDSEAIQAWFKAHGYEW